MSQYDLNSKFDIELHKATYHNYLEVVILSDGNVEYAVPSHQEKLIKLACDVVGVTREQLSEMCPRKYWCDYMYWLCSLSGAIAVWGAGLQYFSITQSQRDVLNNLKSHGLYSGIIPDLKIKEESKL